MTRLATLVKRRSWFLVTTFLMLMALASVSYVQAEAFVSWTSTTPYSTPVAQNPIYSIQVGAWGDNASIGNTGVGSEIQTRIYNVASHLDSINAFWVGDNLQNGAFIQFGYELFSPGYYCLNGHEVVGGNGSCADGPYKIGADDARWFWEYWPNEYVVNFYIGIGPANSAGQDGSWHLFQISPNSTYGWNFVLDGQTVSSFDNFQVTNSTDPAYFVAEEVANQSSPSGNLGPVEFRNLSYYNGYEWLQVQSLYAISECGALDLYCDIIPYGITLLAPNDVIVGTSEQLANQGQLLWTAQLTATFSGDFSLSVNPQLVWLPPGVFVGSESFILGVRSLQGWNGEVEFTISALPKGITVSGLPLSYDLGPMGAAWAVEVQIGASTPSGNYNLTITGSSGSLIHETSVTILVA